MHLIQRIPCGGSYVVLEGQPFHLGSTCFGRRHPTRNVCLESQHAGAVCLRARQSGWLRSGRNTFSCLPDVLGGGGRSEIQGGRLKGRHSFLRSRRPFARHLEPQSKNRVCRLLLEKKGHAGELYTVF